MITKDQLWGLLEGEAIQLLLAGNDTCCFTTSQFADAREQVLNRLIGPRPEDVPLPPLSLVRRQLQALSPVVLEVRQDVWTVRDTLNND